ncbi:MAG: Hpt domain-containing protein [bacterium]
MTEDFNPDDILRSLLEEEMFVGTQTINYQEFLPEFIIKAIEELEIIEFNALVLEQDFDNIDSINIMFRAFHNIKGSSGFVGQSLIQKIAHETETLMDCCRKGTSKVNVNITNLLLLSADFIKTICENLDMSTDEDFIDQIQKHLINLERELNNNLDNIIEGTIEIVEAANDEFWEDFVLEAKDHLDSIEKNIINLEKNLEDDNFIHLLFRDIHSIKGLAGFSGQVLIQRISQDTESLLDCCRKRTMRVNSNTITFLFKSVDLIKKICDDLTLIKNNEFLNDVHKYLADLKEEEQIQEEQLNAEDAVDDEFLEDFIFEAKEHIESIETQLLSLEKTPDDAEIIHSMFRAFHTIKGLAGFVNQTLIQKIAHQTETLMDSCRKGKIDVDKTIVNLILASSDFIKKICDDISIAKDRGFISTINHHLQEIEYYELHCVEAINLNGKKIGEILVEQKILDQEDVNEVLLIQKEQYPDLKFGQVAVKEDKIKSVEALGALKVQQTKQNASSEEYMRIATSKVDSLVDMVGELIIAQSLIEQHSINKYATDNFFIANLGRMTRITKDLQNISMFLRMVALKSTFQKITRIARDTINELGKDINFTTIGDDTEIDRIVTEKILDPLVHLVKNSISHGIETKEERIKSGKSPQGNVQVFAYNKRGSIYIEISDDGKGIDIDKVYNKALEKNLIDPNKDYSEKEIQDFILLPGFSTVEVANNISGRGVGMDVVKTEILKIGGKLEINSVKGQGSTFILKIPVNHAVLNGTIVDIEGSNYIIPTVNVKQILQPKEEQWVCIQGIKSMIKVREDIMPIISVSELFKTGKPEEEPRLIVIVELDQKFKALPVRNVIGRQEIVVKPTGQEFSNLKYVSGMSILGDGKVSLILDIEHLYEKEGAQ